MELWTAQTKQAYDNYLETGRFVAVENLVNISHDENWINAYKWISSEMYKRIGKPPDGIKYPMWAWYQYNGSPFISVDHKKTLSRYKNYIVTFTIDDKSVLLSDSKQWQIPINGFGFISDDELCNLSSNERNQKICQSWETIFNLKSPNIQATMWEIRKEQILAIEEI